MATAALAVVSVTCSNFLCAGAAGGAVPIAVTAEQRAIAESVSQWAKRAGAIAAVRELETRGGGAGGLAGDRAGGGTGRERADSERAGDGTGDPDSAADERWAALAELGVFSVGLPEDLGGAGGTTADVAVVAERLAAALVPGPVMPTLLAGLVLARSVGAAGDGALRAVLAGLASGAARVGVAMSASGVTATPDGAGGLRVSGTAGLVLGAADASHLLLGAVVGRGEAWFLLDARQPGVWLTPRSPVDFSRSLADVGLDAVAVEAGLVLRASSRLVPDLAATLAAAEASGVAAWCSQTATEYARTRQQFGRPIGSFQAIKHLCAQMLCRAELAAASAWDAASAADQAPGELPLAAAAAAAPKHQGITYFLVCMQDRGIEVRPLREITGRAMFNEVFLDEVFVPDDCVVGAPGDGWWVARTTLAAERAAMVRGAGLGEDAERLLAAAAAGGGVTDPVVLDQIGARLAESLGLSVLDDRIAGAVARGGDAGPASAVRKLTGVAHRQAVAEAALALAGVQGAAADGLAADAVDSFLLTRCPSIAGGTSQMLLSLVAERALNELRPRRDPAGDRRLGRRRPRRARGRDRGGVAGAGEGRPARADAARTDGRRRSRGARGGRAAHRGRPVRRALMTLGRPSRVARTPVTVPPSASRPVSGVSSQTGTPADARPARSPAASAWPGLIVRRRSAFVLAIRPTTLAVVQIARGCRVPRLSHR